MGHFPDPPPGCRQDELQPLIWRALSVLYLWKTCFRLRFGRICMVIKEVIIAINRMQADGIIDRYAIGGNHAKTSRFNRKS